MTSKPMTSKQGGAQQPAGIRDVARKVGVSVATAKRHWAYARAFLYEEIQANNRK